jgi:hypothetical protein
MPDQADVDAITDSITDGAQQPLSATVDGNSATQQSIDDKIKAAQYAAGQVAAGAGNGHFGLRFSKLIPPGGG